MSAPAIPRARSDGLPKGRSVRAVDRVGRVVEGGFRLQAAVVFAFLYLPIVVVVVYSFNANRIATIWTGISLNWYAKALGDTVVQNALRNSFIVALPNAILATVFGTMAALGLQRVGRRTRLGFDALIYISVIIPEIVIALATLVMFAIGFDAINPILRQLQGPGAIKLNFGHFTIIAAHVLFNLSLVILLLRARLSGMDRTHVEASYDLYATPWQTFRQITFPQLLPAIVAGFMLSFTFSFDDYVITSFVSGPGSSTLPLFIFGQVKRGVSPETNAVATVMLGLTLAMLVVGQLVLTRNARRRGAGREATMTGMIAEG